jgi:ABC-2 type transport system permease protein
MLRSVFSKTVWERRNGMIGWTIGVAALVAVTAVFYPTIRDQQESFGSFFDTMEDLASAFGVDSISEIFEPPGYLNSQLYAQTLTIVVLVFSIGMGTAAVAGEEDRKTMDLLLAHPVPRWRIVVEKFAAMTLLTFALALLTLVVLLVFNEPTGLRLGFIELLAANLGMGLLALFFGTLALAIGAVTGRRGLTIGVSAGAAVAAFFLFGFAPAIEAVEWSQVLSPFWWYLGGRPLTAGFDVMLLGLVAGIALLLAVAVWGFERRDVAV